MLGLVGTNGIGKSTALKVLAGKQKPNLGRFNDPPGNNQVLLQMPFKYSLVLNNECLNKGNIRKKTLTFFAFQAMT